MTSEELQERLTLKMMEKLEGLGSTLYSATWKAQVTPAQRLLFRVRASVRRTSETGFTGWPTPTLADDNRSRTQNAHEYSVKLLQRAQPGSNLATTAQAYLAGWPTPGSTIVDHKPRPPIVGNRKATDPQIGLADVAYHLAGWPTTTATDASRGVKEARPWDTSKPLGQIVALTGPARLTDTGELLTGSSAGMASSGQLNPEHSRWLMGLPPEWSSCAPTEMPSTRKRPKPLLSA